MRQIAAETQMQTKDSLIEDLWSIGVKPGMDLMVHSSLSAIGWVLGGAPTVVTALLEVIGRQGTLVMPSATPLCADPTSWDEVSVPDKWLEDIRINLPVFDVKTTPTTMGAIAECFRTWPHTIRSNHPISSVCANGARAQEIVSEHALAFSEGAGTPFEKLYDLNASVLLLGVGFNRCTVLHFAESLVSNRRTKLSRFPMLKDGQRIWEEVPDMGNDNSTHFPAVGEKFVADKNAQSGLIGQAKSTLFSVPELVRFARPYFEKFL
ncbi:AAC(3) family N-acetyltransferase [Fulvivirgaceae bacterium BMA12]|uniref:Aminoglycoside N(3)-acetyltransferase n=1 Tax=Agaribacillus aureus TaxID=3051825 RepID=A0ABT8LJA1_9BACT|nr:AAC(3) family N-acetyltransferase [Fulvivirgaceae bacterium BMA12]